MELRANGKVYRRIAPPRNERVCGQYEFFYPIPNGKPWHRVLNRQIRSDLDVLAAEQMHANDQTRAV